MEHKCEKKDDIAEIKLDVKELKKSFDEFKLKTSVEIAKIAISERIITVSVGFVVSTATAIIIKVLF